MQELSRGTTVTVSGGEFKLPPLFKPVAIPTGTIVRVDQVSQQDSREFYFLESNELEVIGDRLVLNPHTSIPINRLQGSRCSIVQLPQA